MQVFVEWKGQTLVQALLCWVDIWLGGDQFKKKMISFQMDLWALEAQLQSVWIYQCGVTPTQSLVTPEMKMPRWSDWYLPRSSQCLLVGWRGGWGKDTVHMAAWIIPGGVTVLQVAQDKLWNNKYCSYFFFFPDSPWFIQICTILQLAVSTWEFFWKRQRSSGEVGIVKPSYKVFFSPCITL